MKFKLFGLIIAIFLVTMMFSIPLISAMDWDNIKEFEKTEYTSDYGKIDIYNSWIIPNIIKGDKLATYNLNQNTDSCGISCTARGNATFYTPSVLFQEINAYGLDDETLRNNVNIKIYLIEKYVEDDKSYTSKCGFELNGTWMCNQLEGDEQKVTKERLIEYKGEELIGDVEWLIYGEKEGEDSVDWIGTTLGKDLVEWADWTGNLNLIANDTLTSTTGWVGSGLTADANGLQIGGGGSAYKQFTGSNNWTEIWLIMKLPGPSYIMSASVRGGTGGAGDQFASVDQNNWNCNGNAMGDLSMDNSAVYFKAQLNGTQLVSWFSKVSFSAINTAQAPNCTTVTDGGNQINDSINFYNHVSYNKGYFKDLLIYEYVEDNREFTTTQSYPVNYFNTTDTTLDLSCNFTSTENNISSVNITVWDSSNNVDYQNTEVIVGEITDYNKTWTTTALADDTYNWSCGGFGKAGLNASSSNRTFTLDANSPVLTIEYPTNNTNLTINNTGINFTVSDTAGHLQSCWYNTGNATNTSIACNTANITGSYPQGSNNISIWANDSFGNLAKQQVTFFIDSIQPKVVITSPANNSVSYYNLVGINYTVADTNLQSCWYSNDTANTTLTCGNNISQFFEEGSRYVQIWANDTYGNINTTSITFLVNTTANLTYNYQIPSDLNTLNSLVTGINISYNVTGADNSTITLFYKTNNTLNNVQYYQNGTNHSGYFRETSPTNNGDNSFTWHLQDNSYLPGTYNVGEITMENTVHLNANLGGNDYTKIQLLNVTNTTSYGFYEVMINSTGTANANIYYCNSSYITGSVAINSNCVQFGTIIGNASYNHRHTVNSAHQIFPFAVNRTTGQIGTVKVTSTSYFLVNGGTGWSYYYISAVARGGASQVSNNNGIAWGNLSGSLDSHLHQFENFTTFYYYTCVNSSTRIDNQICSPIRSDLFEQSFLPPTAGNVYSPIQKLYGNTTININYTSWNSPTANTIVHYNITLLNASDLGFNSVIRQNNSMNLSYGWSPSAIASGNYVVRVQGCDNQSLCSFADSINFSLDTFSPNITIINPPFTNSTFNVSGTFRRINDTGYDWGIDTSWGGKSTTNGTGIANGNIFYNLTTLNNGGWVDRIVLDVHGTGGNSAYVTATFIYETGTNYIVSSGDQLNSPAYHTISLDNDGSRRSNKMAGINFTVTGTANTLYVQNIHFTSYNFTNFTYTNQSVINFTINVSDNVGIDNATINIYNSTGTLVNQTNTGFLGYLTGLIGIVVTLPDQLYTWFWDVADIANNAVRSSNSTLLVDANKPVISITSPAATNFGLVTHPYSVPVSYTITDPELQSCWYNTSYNSTLAYFTCNNPLTLIVYDNTTETHTLYMFANDSLGNQNEASTTWEINGIIGVIYNQVTVSGSTEVYYLNISSNPVYTAVSPFLVYNGTNYAMSSVGGIYEKTLIIPNIAPSQNMSFYFSILFSNATANIISNSTTYLQNVTAFMADNCTAYQKKVLNFRIVDEETLANISGTVNIDVKFYSADRSLLINTFNASLNYDGINSASVCLANLTSTYSMDYTTQFYSNQSLYYIKYKSLQNFTLTNATLGQNITLYDLLITSGNIFQVYVTGSPVGNNGLLVDIQKQYLSQDQFVSVESYITDNAGQAVAHLVQASAIYNFVISLNGRILGTFTNYQVKCANVVTGDCSVRLNLYEATAEAENFYAIGNISGAFLLNKNSTTLYFTYIATDSNIHNIRQVVMINDGFTNNSLYNTTSIGTSGTMQYEIPASYGNTTFYVNTYVDNNFVNSRMFSLGQAVDMNGVDVIMELLMYSSIILLFTSNPVLIVIGGMIGIVMSILLIFLSGATTFVVLSILAYYVAAGILIIIKIRKAI